MKKIFALLCFSFALLLTFGQTSGGPDPYGYTWKSSDDAGNPPVYKWFDITTIGTQVTGLSDDNVVGPYSSTGFQYYWCNMSQFWIGSNGYITFTGDNIASPFPASIPLSSGSNNWIAPFLSDLNFSGTGNPATCYYYTNSDTVCVSFIDVPFWVVTGNKYTGRNSFQIILNKVDKSITFNYLETSLGTKVGLNNAIGIENSTGYLGIGSFFDSLVKDTFCIKYYYPSTVTYQAFDAGMIWNGNTDDGGTFIKSQGSPISLIAGIKNYGNQTLTNINVLDTIFNAAGTSVSTGTATVSSISPCMEGTITFSNSFSPSLPGIYSFKSYITGVTGDTILSNNIIEQEVIAIDTTSGQMIHDYSDASQNGAGLGWNGGDGGIGLYIKPAIYPAKVKAAQYTISANAATPVGFYSKIYDDDGPNGDRGTLLDSVYVPPNSITLNIYTIVQHQLSSNIIIDSGGLYLVWQMDGAGINLARDQDPPISRRTYEILGPGWSGYRRKLTEDFLMGLIFIYPYPEAEFTWVNGLDPTVVFYDVSTNDPTSWFWKFGDGDTSTMKNPQHVFDENGTYNVCLTVSNSWGSDSVCHDVEIKKVIPTALFTYNPSNMPTIAFQDLSVGPPTEWHWTFGSNPSDTSDLQNPLFTFTSNGTVEVCLIAGNANGSSAPYCQDIDISGVGIDEINSLPFRVYPNPLSDQAVIEYSGDVDVRNFAVKAYNSNGSTVDIHVNKAGNRLIVHRDGLIPGMYFLEVRNPERILNRIPLQVQ